MSKIDPSNPTTGADWQLDGFTPAGDHEALDANPEPGALTRKASDLRFLQAVNAVMQREGFKNNRQFLAAHGLNLAMLNKIRTGLQSAPADVVTMMATRYGLSLNYIYLGLEPMFLDDLTTVARFETQNQTTYRGLRKYEIPFLSARATATFAESLLDDNQYSPSETIEILSDQAPSPGTIAVEISGDSMADQLNEGARILVTPLNQADWKYANSGVYAAIYGNSHFVVKRIKDNTLLTDGTLTLHSDNPKHGSNTILGDDLRYLWQVQKILEGKVR